ncbi:MAG: hypothetical protein WKF84_23500 [Pyrinomonadaceae bacterium]
MTQPIEFATDYTFAANGNFLFAGTLERGVFRSGDNGQSWNEVNLGLTNTNVNVLVSSGERLFAGTNSVCSSD